MPKLTLDITDEPVMILVIPLGRRQSPPSDRPTFDTTAEPAVVPPSVRMRAAAPVSNVVPLRRAG